MQGCVFLSQTYIQRLIQKEPILRNLSIQKFQSSYDLIKNFMKEGEQNSLIYQCKNIKEIKSEENIIIIIQINGILTFKNREIQQL
ncbi:hypothetical protein pb186bvf_015921 [Paramecium bursaria]